LAPSGEAALKQLEFLVPDLILLRVKTHVELSASRKKIIEMNKPRDILYSVIAHDLRTPLAGLSNPGCNR
jgi:hypothetical protein